MTEETRSSSARDYRKVVEVGFYAIIITHIAIYVSMLVKSAPLWGPYELLGINGNTILNTFLYVGVIILSLATTIRLVRYYYEFGSYEYLILATILYCIGFAFFTTQYFSDYLTTMWADFNNLNTYAMPHTAIIVLYIYFGYFLVLVYLIRVQGWKNIHPGLRVLLLIAIYMRLVGLGQLTEIIIANDFWVPDDDLFFTKFLFIDFPVGDLWFLNQAYTFVDSITWICTIIVFLFVKPTMDIPSLRRSRYVWVTFGVILLLIRLVADYIQLGNTNLTSPEVIQATYRIWGGGNFILFAMVLITLIYYPQALLMTTNQLIHATRLYKYTSLPTTSDSKSFFGDYRNRVAAYVQSLPEEILIEAGLGGD